MTQNIYFIGGIHGAGKGTICKDIITKCNLIHLTASEVLKWEDISSKENKKVEDIDKTQNLLISNLKNIVEPDKKYLLDGHYCLLNKDSIPERVNKSTFIDISPKLFIIVIENVEQIKERLELRDQKQYDINFLRDFQNLEIEYSEYLSKELNKPLIKILNRKFDDLLKIINDENIT
jgi:adenylate kinase